MGEFDGVGEIDRYHGRCIDHSMHTCKYPFCKKKTLSLDPHSSFRADVGMQLNSIFEVEH